MNIFDNLSSQSRSTLMNYFHPDKYAQSGLYISILTRGSFVSKEFSIKNVYVLFLIKSGLVLAAKTVS